MPKPFLIIQLRPEDETADNEFESIKLYGGLADHDMIRVRAEVSGLPALDLNDYAAIIVGGSPFNVSEVEDQKSTIQKQVETDFFELFDAIVDWDFPFLGCCSGNGLLGSYCGATISRKYGEPVGGVNIELTEAGRLDPLLEGLPDSFRVLLGHKEACDALPPGCVLLATNESCPVQMFRLKKNIYATQFHPEGDAQGFIVRIHAYKHYGYFPPESAQQLIETVENEHVPEAQSILRRFVELYR
ncbi:MAG: glutamine amidotransferase [Gammaproteobacteria bacterium]|jgi:GMP synthase (glutamine-hydrolysing)|nr:glutamine amidotransferase [Gammaproteobacteria bacterium]HJN94270.1 glutamine amidotransferase [Gammaproteobacteria bacterium]|tara:strand:- start:48 stop:779 length:732 start_codon:yes stop_codon:yes gene_type:complete